jgi:glycerol-3-phosphate dehydrogenase
MKGLKHYLFNAQKREEVKTLLASKEFDVLIIGGGITGAGILLDAASRGLSAALIEKEDYASGTSSRSTKLIHGGLRYLKNFEFKLVREVGKERAIVYNIAPHLVVPEKMLLPLVKGGSFGKFGTGIGLWLYDKLAGVTGEDKRKILSKGKTLEIEPTLRNDILKGAGYYAEYRTNDARLTLEITKTAVQLKATAINYAAATDLVYENKKITGVKCIDVITKTPFSIKAKKIVNATGPWVDELRKKDKSLSEKKLHLTKGVHIVVNREKLPIKNSIYFDVEGGRMIFAIPRQEITYIGTTDTDFSEDKNSPKATKEDAQYLIDATNRMFPNAELKLLDILSSWSGIRPLVHEDGKNTSELSRKDELFVSNSGLITIAGGKLTGYRLMAKKVVDLISKQLNINHKCTTQNIKISGGEFDTPDLVDSFILSIKSRLKSLKLSEKKAEYLVRTYGKQANSILEIFENENFNVLVEAEVWFSLRYDSTITLIDFFLRRTGKINFEPLIVLEEAKITLPQFVKYLNWNKLAEKSAIKDLENYLTSVTTFE